MAFLFLFVIGVTNFVELYLRFQYTLRDVILNIIFMVFMAKYLF